MKDIFLLQFPQESSYMLCLNVQLQFAHMIKSLSPQYHAILKKYHLRCAVVTHAVHTRNNTATNS